MLTFPHATNGTPVIATARLHLRGHQVADFAACAAMWADPVVNRFISGKPSTDQQTWARMLSYVGHWQLMGFGYWLIEERETGAFLGELGFADFKRDIQPALNGTPEIGWALASGAHGKGFAKEAIKAAIAWGDAHLTAQKTVCIINPANQVSIHVAETCGYREVSQSTYGGQPTTMFARVGPGLVTS